MTEMVERAARVLARRAEPNWPPEAAEALWSEFVDDAKAVISAMREPTEGMIAAIDNEELMAWECFRGDGEAWKVADVYSIMIDAALKEG
jgi:hypothetical protein